MYKERGHAVKGEMVGEGTSLDRKRISEALDKHLEKSSPSTSRGGFKGSSKQPPSTSSGKLASKNKASGESESDVSGCEVEDTSWISWFCGLRGNEFFCEVDYEYVRDDFNLCGLSNQVPYYDYALNLILDIESSPGDMFTEESAAEMLYGLIHVRYILTSKGMAAMLEKFKNYDFGWCPRVYCCGQPCLPVGQSNIPRSSTVKIYCPKCNDIYYPRSEFQGNIDGAYFGTTFPNMFLMTDGHLKPQNLRPGPNNHGMVKYPRSGQPSNRFTGGGILSPMPAGGPNRSGSDMDRWQHTRRGLIPSPVASPHEVMHKAKNKYVVGKISSEEEAKQRQLKGILNKLTPQNFVKLFVQVKGVNIDNLVTLSGVTSQIFDRVLMEPIFCEIYASFCVCAQLRWALPDFTDGKEKITFKRLLLNKCQEEFEREEAEAKAAGKSEEEGKVEQTPEEREEKRLKARGRRLGNIHLIGELYKKKMLTERIMHECIKKLLGPSQNPDEEDIESLCKLMSTIGEMIDQPRAKEHLDLYFDIISKLSNNKRYSSRVRFMLKDTIDLRKNRWQQRRKVEGPKKIEDLHRNTANERQAQTTRLTCGTGLISPISQQQTGSIRGMFPNRNQGIWYDERQGSEWNSGFGSRLTSPDERTRQALGSAGGWSSSASNLERNISTGTNRTVPVPSPQAVPAVSAPIGLPDNVIKEKSISAIMKYVSAKDEKEVRLCIEEMNSPGSFHLIISSWIKYSFERKNVEREMIFNLLINLSKPTEGLFDMPQLHRGFEVVLSTLEDILPDVPKAAEYLGELFAKCITEGFTSLAKIGRIILQSGEEPGMLIKAGIGEDLIGCTLESIKKEKCYILRLLNLSKN